MTWPVDEADISEIAEPLRRVLEDELHRGNKVVQTWRGWPEGRSICVMLSSRFRESARNVHGLEYSEIADPHYWGEELFDRTTGHLLCVEWSAAFRRGEG